MNELKSKYRFIVYEADATLTPWTQCCIRRAGLARLSRTPITIWVGKPLRLSPVATSRDVAANTERIMRSMAAMLPPKYRGYYKDGVARANGVGEALRDEFGAATDKQLAER